MSGWVLLTYRVPRQPSAARVFVWRRLRRLGAILLHDSVWVLPYSAFTREQAQWLASEIRDLHGESTMWLADPFPASADRALVQAFRDQASRTFTAIAADAKAGKPTGPLSRMFQDACRADYLRSPRREHARNALLRAARARSDAKASRGR